MTSFYTLLLLVNFMCFVPLYALNFREHPNPFEFLVFGGSAYATAKRIYARPGFTDPLRVNVDFSLAILVAATARADAAWVKWSIAAVLTITVLEICYTSVMRSIFKRPPSLASDLKLAKAGLSIAHRHLFWLLPAIAMAIIGLALAGSFAVSTMLTVAPESRVGPLGIGALICAPCLLHWRVYAYEHFSSRAFHSSTLHLYRNWTTNRKYRWVYSQDREHFRRHNFFSDLTFSNAPSIVIICVESYGSAVFRDTELRRNTPQLLDQHERRLQSLGYRSVSNFSAAPIFAGGSWLSYVSFTYGFKIDDLDLYDQLFSYRNGFETYESLFHVLRRNGYKSYALCPLGGVDTRAVNWAPIDRCFQSDWNIDFESLGYRGPRYGFLGKRMLHCAPDQYALNRGYELVSRACDSPFSLFFCTLNSHFPWDSPVRSVSDWRSLDETGAEGAIGRTTTGSAADRFIASIHYQLDYIFRFVADHAEEDLVFVIFGDHQPPTIVPESAGSDTPVHIVVRNSKLAQCFEEHGFVPRLNLTNRAPRTIRHEGFLSLFLKAMHASWGTASCERPEYRALGAPLLTGYPSSAAD